MVDYYKDTLTTIISRRLQKKQSQRSLVTWPPQNALKTRPPTRGTYRQRTATSNMKKMPNKQFPTIGRQGIQTSVKTPKMHKFSFLQGL